MCSLSQVEHKEKLKVIKSVLLLSTLMPLQSSSKIRVKNLCKKLEKKIHLVLLPMSSFKVTANYIEKASPAVWLAEVQSISLALWFLSTVLSESLGEEVRSTTHPEPDDISRDLQFSYSHFHWGWCCTASKRNCRTHLMFLMPHFCPPPTPISNFSTVVSLRDSCPAELLTALHLCDCCHLPPSAMCLNDYRASSRTAILQRPAAAQFLQCWPLIARTQKHIATIILAQTRRPLVMWHSDVNVKESRPSHSGPHKTEKYWHTACSPPNPHLDGALSHSSTPLPMM